MAVGSSVESRSEDTAGAQTEGRHGLLVRVQFQEGMAPPVGFREEGIPLAAVHGENNNTRAKLNRVQGDRVKPGAFHGVVR